MMTTKTRDLITFILDRNKAQSKEFCAPGSQLARRLYRAQHPSEILALKCMDGRLNLSVMTNTPPGIIKPYRNIGGRFDLGWPFFGRLMLESIEYSVSKGRPTIVSKLKVLAGTVDRNTRQFMYNICLPHFHAW